MEFPASYHSLGVNCIFTESFRDLEVCYNYLKFLEFSWGVSQKYESSILEKRGTGRCMSVAGRVGWRVVTY